MKREHVYWNLHKRVWSVRLGGRVVDHSLHVVIEAARFKVNPAGRQKVLEEKRKNVHAFVVGRQAPEGVLEDACGLGQYGPGVEVSYNPYRPEGTFYRKDTGEAVVLAAWAEMRYTRRVDGVKVGHVLAWGVK